MMTKSALFSPARVARRTLAVLLGVGALVAGGASPQAQTAPTQLDFPATSPGVPAYARLELLIPNFDVPNNERWAAIVFYRDPACIPADFDLGRFFDFPTGPADPGAFGCPLLVEGREIWRNGPGQDAAPIYVRTRNAVPDLPVWFVAWHDLQPLLRSGQVFIGEIARLPSLLPGRARWFEEALYPNGTAARPGITLRAEGRLETGGDFKLDWHFAAGEKEQVTIALTGIPRSHRVCQASPAHCR